MKFTAALFLFLFSSGCSSPPKKKVHRSFYYWKSGFSLTGKEKGVLADLKVSTLFIKFFDVVWDHASQQPEPVARISFREKPSGSLAIIPVIYITNETLQQLKPGQLNMLAKNMASLLTDLAAPFSAVQEIQVDCDWTAGTRDTYFDLLKELRAQPWMGGKKLSVTVRLHQLKYKNITGIPPADKGLLMCYNMGNLRNPETGNSIIEPSELKKYIGGLGGYRLQLDIALPLFDWFVLFRQGKYKALVHTFRVPSLPKENRLVTKDTSINNFRFEKGDWLRYEQSKTDDVLEVAKLVNKRIRQDEMHVVLYHLDELLLNKYQTYELEAMFNSFH